MRTASPFVLPGVTKTDRVDLIRYEFADWMRSIGWERETYSKAAHELRKLQGSRWFTEVSPVAAQAWLGHQSIETTCKYYAKLIEQPAPLPLAQAATNVDKTSTGKAA